MTASRARLRLSPRHKARKPTTRGVNLREAVALATLIVAALALPTVSQAASPPQASPTQLKSCLSISAPGSSSNPKPYGWPCPEFKNPQAVLAYVKELLVDNGVHRAGMRWWIWPRQFRFQGNQDGYLVMGTVTKSGPQQIAIQSWPTSSGAHSLSRRSASTSTSRPKSKVRAALQKRRLHPSAPIRPETGSRSQAEERPDLGKFPLLIASFRQHPAVAATGSEKSGGLRVPIRISAPDPTKAPCERGFLVPGLRHAASLGGRWQDECARPISPPG